MMSTQPNNNNFVNVAAAPQPVFVQMVPPAPTLFNFAPVMPAMSGATPAPPSLTPLLPLPPTLTKVSNVPASTLPTIMYFDGSTVSPLPAYLIPTVSQGVLTPPVGFSFATLNCSPQLPPVVADSDSTGNVEDLSPEPTPEPVAPKSPVQKARKFKHGSKQDRIMEVYNAIQQKYTDQGVYAGEHEVLRGADTVRVHVKTYKGLNKIQAALQEVDDCPDVRLRKLATPFSMKNRFQKKGFIVYLRLESPDMVESVKAVFKKYEEFFRKCDVAMPKPTDPASSEPVENKISDFFGKGSDGFYPLPLPMVKQTSAPGNAA